MAGPLITPDNAGFRSLGSPMHPAVSEALGRLLVLALPVEQQALLHSMIATIGVAGFASLIDLDPSVRAMWRRLVNVACMVYGPRAQQLRREGSTLCSFAIDGRKGGR